MRVKFDLDKQVQQGFTIMTHGDRAVGKTHLIGDMLKYEAEFGKVGYINVAGEDGMLTISNLGLGNIGETIDSYDDLLTIIDEYGKAKYQAVGLDSLMMFARLARFKITNGVDRPLLIPSNDQLRCGMINEWPIMHNLMEAISIKLRRTGKYVMVTAASDKASGNLDLSVKPKNDRIAPNLPGKEAGDCVGWFDYMGYIDIKFVRPGVIQRTFSMTQDGVIAVRQRVPRMIKEVINLPEGPGGWKLIKEKIEEACK